MGVLWVLALAACSNGVAESDGGAGAAPCSASVEIAHLPQQLAEASGIARDPRRQDVLWLHNDSGNDAALFAVDTAGGLAGTVPIIGATSRDPEDIAVAECDGDWCLWYGDMGDNDGVRPEIHIHRLTLPPVPTQAAVPADPVGPEMTYAVRYPGGPRDAEALVVDARRGELVIVSKGREGVIEMFAADLATLEAVDGPVILRRVGRLAVPSGGSSTRYITAGDLSPAGDWLALRSYSTLYLFRWSGTELFDTLAAPLAASLLPALEPQGEGLAFQRDSGTIYLASEGRDGRPPQLSRIDCRP